MAERDASGKLVQYRGPGVSPDCASCPCARNGVPFKAVPAFGATGGLAVVGEGPGSDEVFQGYPFIGPSGKILTRILSSNRIDRQLLWITNALLCARPKDDTQFAAAVNCCRPRLVAELEMIKPTAIVALGGTAVRALQLPVHTIIEARGTVQNSPLVKNTPVITTIHPAALFKGGAGETGGGKQKMNVDAQHMFLERDIVKAYRVANGEIEPTWSDDIEVYVEPGPNEELGNRQPDIGFDPAFMAFHEANPAVCEILIDTARFLAAPGCPLAPSINGLWSVVRFRASREHKIEAIPPLYQIPYTRYVTTQDAALGAFIGALR